MTASSPTPASSSRQQSAMPLVLSPDRAHDTASSAADGSGEPEWGRRDVESLTHLPGPHTPSTLRDASRRLRLLGRAARSLHTSLELPDILASLTDILVPHVVDWCAVELLKRGGRLERVLVAHSDPTRATVLHELLEAHGALAHMETGVDTALKTIRPVIRELADSSVLATLGARTLTVPLTAHGQLLGTVTVGTDDPDRGSDSDHEVIEEVAIQVALAIAHAELYEESRHVATQLMRDLAPPELPRIPGVELAVRYEPAGSTTEVGGDFYDAFTTDGRSWVLVVGDVQGKGVPAAATSALVRHVLRTAALGASGPREILARANTTLSGLAGYHDLVSRLCTAVALVVTPQADGPLDIDAASAGHPLPILLGPAGVQRPGRPGTILGAFPDGEWPSSRLSLGPDDALVCLTDGVLEARTGRRFFDDELDALLATLASASPAELTRRIGDAATTFAGGTLSDDMAILALRPAAS